MAERLNYQQLAKLALDAGWKGKDAETAVAIAVAESRFNPMATNFKGRDYSYGLWQINMIGDMGTQRRAKYQLPSNEALFNPATNARVAYAIWKDAGGNFRDWSTYNNRRFLAYLNGAVFAVKQIQQGKQPDEVPDYSGDDSYGDTRSLNPLSGIDAVADAIKGFGEFVTNRENWLRAAAILGGAILLILAVFLLMTDTIVAQALKKVGKAAKVGGALK